jgi:hypothetical protein
LDRRSARRKAATYTAQHKHRARKHISMPRMVFEPTIPVFERVKTFALNLWTYKLVVVGSFTIYRSQ